MTATVYATHELEESGDLWLHTHGLTRLGLPEIELLGLDESTVREGYDLIDATVDAALGGAEPDEHHRLTVGEGLTMKVTRVDVSNHRLILSVKAWLADQDDIALAEWTSKRNQVRARIAANPPVEDSVAAKVPKALVDDVTEE